MTHIISFTVSQSDVDIGEDVFEDSSEFDGHRKRKANIKKARYGIQGTLLCRAF